jgi:hypothetical protein
MKIIILMLLLAASVRADETYSFQSPVYPVYSNWPCIPCGVSPAFISGSFTTSLTSAQLSSLTDFVIPNYDIISFDFNDHNSVDINEGNAILAKEYFQITTDASASIVPASDWGITLENTADGQIGMATIGNDWSGTPTTYGQTGLGAGGVWLGPVDPSPAPTPEAPTWMTYILAVLILMGVRWMDRLRAKKS